MSHSAAEKDPLSRLACVGASRAEDSRLSVPSLPPVRFPAWCLAARGTEAVLAFRGSTTPGDWTINSDADEVHVEGLDAQFTAHGGIYRAARAVLEDCGAGATLAALRGAGVSITVVGHSLGAGVGVLATALLNLSPEHAALKPVKCVAYATPACCSPALAAALAPSITTCVLRDDVVPRLSEAHCARLAEALVKDDAAYRERFAKDRAAYAAHVRSLGKGEGMVHELKEAAASCAPDDGAPLPEPPPPDCDGDAGLERVPSDEPSLLVPPGRVVFLHGQDGAFGAAQGDWTLPPLQKVQVTPRAVDDHLLDSIAFALRAARARRGRAPAETALAPFQPALDAGAWTPCAVCGSDVCWTSAVRGSDAARAQATHHCRACGRVVCAFCAPAGDAVAGDGIAETVTLPDKRVPLPARGCLGAVRVCRPCHFGSYAM